MQLVILICGEWRYLPVLIGNQMRDGGGNTFLCACGHRFTNSFVRRGRNSERMVAYRRISGRVVEGQPILQCCDLRLL